MSRLIPWVLVAMLKLLEASLRTRLVGWNRVQDLLDRGEPLAYAMRHGDAVVVLLSRPLLPPFTVLVSRSADGELATQLLLPFGHDIVRGSTSRGAVAGLRGLVRAVASERRAFLVVDGPRGPAGVPGPGAAALARLGGAWVVPLSAGCSPSRRLRTWDRTTIPLPFARSAVVVGRPVPPDLDPEEALDHLARRLADGGKRAARLCGARS